jgi:hypothetical protein
VGDDLKPAIVLSVKHAPIPELLAIVLEPAKCSMHCGRSTVQLLCDLVVRHLQVVVELPYPLDHKSSDLVAPQLGLRFGPALVLVFYFFVGTFSITVLTIVVVIMLKSLGRSPLNNS